MKSKPHRPTCALVLAMAFATGATCAQEPTTSGSAAAAVAQAVTSVAVTVSRDAGGRIERFADVGGREFIVTYDESGHVSGINSPVRRNRADVRHIDYADGKLVSASLGDDNVLLFSYDRDGVEYVRDRYGALIRRVPSAKGYVIISDEDPSNSLRGMLDRLDALLKVLSAPK